MQLTQTSLTQSLLHGRNRACSGVNVVSQVPSHICNVGQTEGEVPTVAGDVGFARLVLLGGDQHVGLLCLNVPLYRVNRVFTVCVDSWNNRFSQFPNSKLLWFSSIVAINIMDMFVSTLKKRLCPFRSNIYNEQ